MTLGVIGDRHVHRIGLGAKRLLRDGYSPSDRDGAVRLLLEPTEEGLAQPDLAAGELELAPDELAALTALG